MSLEKNSFVFLELPANTREQEGLFDDSQIVGQVETTSGEVVKRTVSWYSFYGSVVRSINPEAQLVVKPQVTAAEGQDRQVIYELSIVGIDEHVFTQALCDRLAEASE